MTITTRRSTGPASIFDKSEDQRLLERRNIRIRLAELTLKKGRREELLEQIAAIDAQVDAATDEHSSITSPIQSELGEVVRQQAIDLAERKKDNAKLESRRRELLDELANANEKLETEVQKCKSQKKFLAPELAQLSREVAEGAALEFALRNSAPLADQAAHWASMRSVQFAQQRYGVAQSADRAARDEFARASAEPHKYDLVQFRRRHLQWAAELASAGKMLAAAKAEADECQRRLTED